MTIADFTCESKMAVPLTILIATHNVFKMREFHAMAEGYPVVFKSLTDADLNIDLDEKGSSFDENALYKARTVHALTQDMIVLADDSGLVIDALDGHQAFILPDLREYWRRIMTGWRKYCTNSNMRRVETQLFSVPSRLFSLQEKKGYITAN